MSSTEAQEGARLQQLAQAPHKIGDRAVGVVRRGEDEWEVLDLEKYEDRPYARRGLAQLQTPSSFVRYVEGMKTRGTSLYADVDHSKITAILDGHERVTIPPFEGEAGPGEGLPGWGQHSATLQLRQSAEWQYWMRNNGKLLGQTDFALHIESGAPDIIEPDAATMLEIAQTLHESTGLVVKNGRRLSDGQTQIVYEETRTGHAGEAGQLQIPSKLVLALRVWEDTPKLEVPAVFRYRVEGGQFKLVYEILRVRDIVQLAFDEVVDVVDAALDLTSFRGEWVPENA